MLEANLLKPYNIINRWLLQMLRTSALNVYLLASTAEETNGKLDADWQWLVLESWGNDEYSLPKGGLTASLTTQATLLISTHSGTSSTTSVQNTQFFHLKRSSSVKPDSDSGNSEKTQKASPKSPKGPNSRKTV